MPCTASASQTLGAKKTGTNQGVERPQLVHWVILLAFSPRFLNTPRGHIQTRTQAASMQHSVNTPYAVQPAWETAAPLTLFEMNTSVRQVRFRWDTERLRRAILRWPRGTMDPQLQCSKQYCVNTLLTHMQASNLPRAEKDNNCLKAERSSETKRGYLDRGSIAGWRAD